MGHEKTYGRSLYSSNHYRLQGPFWDGFRSVAKWFLPIYVIFFFLVALYFALEKSNYILSTANFVLCIVATYGVHLSRRKQ